MIPETLGIPEAVLRYYAAMGSEAFMTLIGCSDICIDTVARMTHYMGFIRPESKLKAISDEAVKEFVKRYGFTLCAKDTCLCLVPRN